jgi:prepilin-type N-terminal cleavage/methylation domain-containing protein/prepilin-type processing-associated H-X9-DG protein
MRWIPLSAGGIMTVIPIQLRQRACGGFSLMELLVVIAIVALLAGMLMPAISLVRKSARQANCASNQRQLLAGILLYTNDNESYLPQPFANNAGSSWQGGPLRDYVSDSRIPDADFCKGKGIIGCPEHSNEPITFIMPAGLYTMRFASYALNNAIAGQKPSWSYFTLAQVNQPSRKMCAMDASTPWTFDFGTAGFAPTFRGGFIHRGRANCVFLDGHVEARTDAIASSELVR